MYPGPKIMIRIFNKVEIKTDAPNYMNQAVETEPQNMVRSVNYENAQENLIL